ncbi:MAG: RsmE family RNA methyltransferase [Planctomycetota bacterium]|nr:RsmE family RNA methyltransferase [Planctomycetota bacterium]MDA1162875.1 RsmE family RNA methyltransferase [Planctomycetota bacterium]
MVSRFVIQGDFRSGALVLDGPEFHHMVRVTRHQVGDTVRLFDGTGREADAELTFVTRHSATLAVGNVETIPEAVGPRFSVAIPLPKASRAGWLIEKAVELGVSRIIPLKTERSVVDPRNTKLDTLRQCIIAASKQCGRSRLMELSPVVSWSEFLCRECPDNAVNVAHPGGVPFNSSHVAQSLAEAEEQGRSQKKKIDPEMIVAIGPEGGFTIEEVTQSVTKGARLVSLGPRLLRVETAAVMMASVFLSAQFES